MKFRFESPQNKTEEAKQEPVKNPETGKGSLAKKLRNLGIAASTFALMSPALGQKNKDQHKTIEPIGVLEKNDSVPYNKDFYTPESKKYNPLQVYKDLSLLFHQEKIKDDTTGYAVEEEKKRVYGEKLDEWAKRKAEIFQKFENDSLHSEKYIEEVKKKIDSLGVVFQEELKKTEYTPNFMRNMFSAPLSLELKKLDQSKPKIDPKEYSDKDKFIEDYFNKMKDWLSKDGKSTFDLRNAYFKGKAMYYKNFLNKYKNNFNLYKKDKPAAALDMDDWSASPVWNESKSDVSYKDKESFEDVVWQWQGFVDDVDTVSVENDKEDRVYGARAYDIKVTINNLKLDALDEWNFVHNREEWQKKMDKEIKEAEQNLQSYNKKDTISTKKPPEQRALESMWKSPLPEIRETNYKPEQKKTNWSFIYPGRNGNMLTVYFNSKDEYDAALMKAGGGKPIGNDNYIGSKQEGEEHSTLFRSAPIY